MFVNQVPQDSISRKRGLSTARARPQSLHPAWIIKPKREPVFAIFSLHRFAFFLSVHGYHMSIFAQVLLTDMLGT